MRHNSLAPRPIEHRVKEIFFNIDVWLLLLLLIFAAVGMTTLYSASDGFSSRFDAQINNWIMAFVLMLVVAQVKPQYLQQMALPLYILGVILLIGVDLFGETRKGATRWLDVGVAVIQPSELMKIAMPLMLAWWFHQRQRLSNFVNFACSIIILGIPVALIILEPDLGTALLVLAAGVSVIFFAGLSWRIVIPPLVIALLAITVVVVKQDELCQPDVDWVVLHDYQKTRVCTLLDPDKDRLDTGFHIRQSTIAIGSGGLKGKGFLRGTQTHLSFLPERTTDFIFAVYAEEFGLIGNGFLLLLYFLLIWRGLVISVQAVTAFSRLLACGMTMIFFICAFVNIGMVSGILPVVGVPLPFMSYGGTALVVFCLAIGVLMSVAGQTRSQRHD